MQVQSAASFRQYSQCTQCDRQANRLFARRSKDSKIDLMTIEAEDVLASRVFTEGMPDEHQSDQPDQTNTSQNSEH